MKKASIITLVLLAMLCSVKVHSQHIPDNTEGRLWGLCKVWGYMKYYHPKICEVNWDSLVNAKIPLVMNATSNADYNTVLMDMVQELGQLTPAQATTASAADSNLNLDTLWMHEGIFAAPLQGFLDTFYSRAGRNDAIQNCYNRPDLLYRDPLSITIDYNNMAHRLTIIFNYWNVFNYFSPYRNLTDQAWDTTLLRSIPEILATTTRKTFDLAFQRMHAHTDDSHNTYQSTYNYFSYGNVIGLKIERIEHKAVITKVQADVNGVQVGDELLELNGIPIDIITDSCRLYIPASNDSRFYYNAYRQIITGMNPNNNQPVVLKLKNAGQQEYTVTLNKNISYATWMAWADADPKPEWRVLCNGYGYVNMAKLTTDHIPDMYADLKDLPAIIFDVRSYLQTSAFDIAPLFMPGPVSSAILWSQTLTTPGRFNFDTNGDSDSFTNPNPYGGKLYFLVNEKAISAAEYFVQYMQHAPDATIVGSQTAGADGGNIGMQMNSIITYYCTMTGVAYTDGYQCQRNGLRIDELVLPTISGIRQGRDEVLEHVTGCISPMSLGTTAKKPASVSLYPNPAQDLLQLSITTEEQDFAHITITDIMGKEAYRPIHKKTGQQAIGIPVDQLDPGIYFIHIQTEKGYRQVLKFVKE